MVNLMSFVASMEKWTVKKLLRHDIFSLNPIGWNLFKLQMTFGRWCRNRDENYFSVGIYSRTMWFIQAWSVDGSENISLLALHSDALENPFHS